MLLICPKGLFSAISLLEYDIKLSTTIFVIKVIYDKTNNIILQYLHLNSADVNSNYCNDKKLNFKIFRGYCLLGYNAV
jgi:hypothetical protein